MWGHHTPAWLGCQVEKMGMVLGLDVVRSRGAVNKQLEHGWTEEHESRAGDPG